MLDGLVKTRLRFKLLAIKKRNHQVLCRLAMPKHYKTSRGPKRKQPPHRLPVHPRTKGFQEEAEAASKTTAGNVSPPHTLQEHKEIVSSTHRPPCHSGHYRSGRTTCSSGVSFAIVVSSNKSIQISPEPDQTWNAWGILGQAAEDGVVRTECRMAALRDTTLAKAALGSSAGLIAALRYSSRWVITIHAT